MSGVVFANSRKIKTPLVWSSRPGRTEYYMDVFSFSSNKVDDLKYVFPACIFLSVEEIFEKNKKETENCPKRETRVIRAVNRQH